MSLWNDFVGAEIRYVETPTYGRIRIAEAGPKGAPVILFQHGIGAQPVPVLVQDFCQRRGAAFLLPFQQHGDVAGKPPFHREEGAEGRPPRKSFGDKPKFGDKKFGDRAPRGDRDGGGASTGGSPDHMPAFLKDD